MMSYLIQYNLAMMVIPMMSHTNASMTRVMNLSMSSLLKMGDAVTIPLVAYRL